MLKKYGFLVFYILTFYPLNIIHAANNINEEILFQGVKSNNIFLAKNSNNDQSVENSITTFSEFDELDDNDIDKIDIYDPFEKLNRKIFDFNLLVDDKVISHVSSLYFYVTPKPIRLGFINFVSNAKDPLSIVNHLLQFKFVSFTKSLLRFCINSTLGCVGLVDVASTLNLLDNVNDFGYTLQYYHVGEGFYIFLPFLGPYTFKNGLATLASGIAYSESINSIININYLYLTTIDFGSRAAYYLECRKDFLNLVFSSPDSYSLVKSAYIQNRMFKFNQLKSTW